MRRAHRIPLRSISGELTGSGLIAVGILMGLVASACQPEDGPDRVTLASVFDGESVEWIDLTHTFDSSTIYWPTAEPFRLEVVAEGMTPGGYYYEANNFCAAEHGGTHLDAPIHFAEGQWTTDEVPLATLIGPAVVVDVSDSAAEDPDYRVTVDDLRSFEAAHAAIPDGAILMIRTGWAERWPDPVRYLGTERRGEAAVAELHFPGLHPDAARWLVEGREIAAVGIDTPSIDYGQSETFESHQILFAHNIPALENVANLDRLPSTGAFIVALPMKIGGGSGGPVRIAAAVPSSF